MKKIKQIILALALVGGIGTLLVPVSVGAVTGIYQPCADAVNKDTAVCQSQGDSANTLILTIVNTLLFVVGIASVIVIIIGGVMYTTSAGDASSVSKAKNTILYAIIGVVVAFLAFAIVNWVVGTFSSSAAQQQCDQKKGVYNATTKTCSK